jgi:HK97 family phage prohead protease
MERKATALDATVRPDDAGRFEGYASVFGKIDNGGDIVAPGAFAKSLASGRKPKLLWQHDPSKPIGVWEDLREDGRGLYGKGRIISDVSQGREALALMRADAIDGLSIGYRTKNSGREGNARVLKEIDLFEVSLVTFPMLDDATVTVKSERDFESLLRENGFSRWDAKIIVASGYKAWLDQRDAEGEGRGTDQRDAEVAELLKAITSNLKGVS